MGSLPTGEKIHVHAHCHSCIEKEWPDGDIVELNDEGKTRLLSQSWVIEGKYYFTWCSEPC